MKSFLLLCVVSALATGVWADCDACINRRCYEKHLLPGAGGFSGAVDRRTNTLYVVNPKNRIKLCNLDTATCKDAAQQSDIWAVTVDQRTGDVYGTLNQGRGIYKLDLVNNNSVVLVSTANVSRLVFKDKFYYTQSNDVGIFTSEGGISRPVARTEESLVQSLCVDKNHDLYYKDLLSGVHVAKSDGQIRVLHEHSHVSVDKNGDAVLIDYLKNTVYNVSNGQLIEIGAVRIASNFYEFLFDRDNNIINILRNESYHLKQVTQK